MDLLIKNIYPNGKIDINTININSENNLLFSIKEFHDIEIKFQFDNEDEFIVIDTYEYNKYKVSDDNWIKINNIKSEIKLVPGYYQIEYNSNLNKRCYYYFVEPQNITWDEIVNLRKYVDRYFKGISKNYLVQRYTINSFEIDYLFQDIEKLKNTWNEVNYLLSMILEYPSFDLIKEYPLSHKLIKIDRNVQRKIDKGNNINTRFVQPKIRYNYNSNDNILLVLRLERFSHNLLSITKSLLKLKNEILSLITLDKTEKDKKKSEKLRIVSKSFISAKYKSDIDNRIKFLEKQIINNQMKLDTITKCIQNVEEVITNVNSFIAEFLTNYKIGLSKNITSENIKDNRYKDLLRLLDLHSNIFNLEEKQNTARLVYSFKSSEVLFEYFCYLRVVEFIIGEGFESTGGWYENAIMSEFGLEIPSESESVFIKDNLLLRVLYDMEAPRKPDQSYSGLYSFNSNNRRPDITLLLYKDGQFVKSLICEVKYRKSLYIYSTSGDTEVVETMKDYHQLRYCEPNKTLIDTVVDKVLLLYPSQQSNIDTSKVEHNNIFSFIPIEVGKDKIEDILYSDLKDFLQKNTVHGPA